MSGPLDVAVDLPERDLRRRASVLLAAGRPRQYTKNLLVFAATIFAAEAASSRAWALAALAFVVYCAASSAGYLVNDVLDAASDRAHPLKKRRPVARGILPPDQALGTAAGLAGLAAAGAAVLGFRSFVLLVAFLGLQVFYTALLKRLPLLDVAAIATLFAIRASAGAAAIDVPASGWLLVCTVSLAALLGFGKRRAELALVRAGRTPGRGVLRRYSGPWLDRLVVVTGVTSLGLYALYAFVGPTPWLALTVPLVAVGILRYAWLIQRTGLGEEPENILFTDPVVIGVVVAWACCSAAILVAV